MEEISIKLLEAFIEIIGSMFHNLSVLWFLIPTIIFWFLLEIYSSKYKEEELGWNAALNNGLNVFWVLIVSMEYLFQNHLKHFQWSKFIALIVLLLYAILIVVNSFSHKLRKKISFLLASPTLTSYVSGIAILWTIGELAITLWVLIDLIIGYGLVLLIRLILHKVIKEKKDLSEPQKYQNY